MFPQSVPVKDSKPDGKRAARDLQLPLLDRSAEADLPAAELARAEDDRYRDIEVGPAIVPTAAERFVAADTGQDAAGRFLDYVRDDQPAPALKDLPIAPPVAVRPSAPEPVVVPELRRASKVPVLLALVIGVILGFGAGYGVGLRQRVESAVPAAGREFTETAVPDAAKPAPESTDAAHQPPVDVNRSNRASAAPAAAPRSQARAPTAPPAAAAADAEGRVLVRTTPAGARVFVDGKEYGVTPFAVRSLALGGHDVRVVRDGYAAEERRIVLTASQPSQSLTIVLDRPAAVTSGGSQTSRPTETGSTGPFTGDLYVVSRPPGAAVFMDGKQVGTTPLSLRAVPSGSHALRLEASGYRRWSSSVRVVASQQNRVTASLEK